MSDFRIGIDPGITGALALLEMVPDPGKSKVMAVLPMPVLPLGKHQQPNCDKLAEILVGWSHQAKIEPIVFLEEVHAMPGQGSVSMFNFGMGYGMVQGVLCATGLSYVLVRPQAWKKRAGLLNTEKDMARTRAQQLCPGTDLSLKKDIGKADAILIASYGKE